MTDSATKLGDFVSRVRRPGVSQFSQEYPDLAPQTMVDAPNDAYHTGHENFYENMYDADHIQDMLADVERELPVLESLVKQASESPRPLTITSNRLRWNLRNVTGNDGLNIGDTSQTGFSNRYRPKDSNDSGDAGSPAVPPPVGPLPTSGGSGISNRPWVYRVQTGPVHASGPGPGESVSEGG